MKFKRSAELEKCFSPLDFVPLIDVIFLAFFFFILNSTFVNPSGIQVKLPRTITSESIKEDSIILTITGENVIYYNGNVITMKEMEAELSRASNKEKSILIKADRRASLGRTIDIWNLCRTLGIEQINIATPQGQ